MTERGLLRFGTPSGRIGLAMFAAFCLVALAAPWLLPYDPLAINYVGERQLARLRPPGGAFLLGTNYYGRDILSQILIGSRVSIGVGLLSALIIVFIGTNVGLVAGYYRGRIDALLLRRRLVRTRVIPELDFLRLPEHGRAPPRRSLRSERLRVGMQIKQVAALPVRVLLRLLHVEEEAGEALAQPHVAHDEEHLLPQHRMTGGLRLEISPCRIARRVPALPLVALLAAMGEQRFAVAGVGGQVEVWIGDRWCVPKVEPVVDWEMGAGADGVAWFVSEGRVMRATIGGAER